MWHAPADALRRLIIVALTAIVSASNPPTPKAITIVVARSAPARVCLAAPCRGRSFQTILTRLSLVSGIGW